MRAGRLRRVLLRHTRRHPRHRAGAESYRTSTPGFRSTQLPDNPKRNWYVWSDTDDRYRDARIIFLDTGFELGLGSYFQVLLLAQFFSHQPDLNLTIQEFVKRFGRS
jgi:hypothetical protein